MASLAGLKQSYAAGLPAAEARKQRKEAKKFNLGSALGPTLASLALAPFTGGASLANIPAQLVQGAALEGVRSATAGSPGAQQLGVGLTQKAMSDLTPPDEWQTTLEARQADLVPATEGEEGAIKGPRNRYWKPEQKIDYWSAMLGPKMGINSATGMNLPQVMPPARSGQTGATGQPTGQAEQVEQMPTEGEIIQMPDGTMKIYKNGQWVPYTEPGL